MGKGYTAKCMHCNYSEEFNLGVGFAYPYAYEENLKAVKEGRHGKRLKKFMQENPNGAIDPTIVLAHCPKCNRIETVPALSAYLPIQGYDPSKRERRRWSTVMPCYDVDYISPSDLHSNYSLVIQHEHHCSKCRTKVEIITEDVQIEKLEIQCPQCGGHLTVKQDRFWD